MGNHNTYSPFAEKGECGSVYPVSSTSDKQLSKLTPVSILPKPEPKLESFVAKIKNCSTVIFQSEVENKKVFWCYVLCDDNHIPILINILGVSVSLNNIYSLTCLAQSKQSKLIVYANGKDVVTFFMNDLTTAQFNDFQNDICDVLYLTLGAHTLKKSFKEHLNNYDKFIRKEIHDSVSK